ncbi:MAG: inorganic pyrophosphatase [Acidobacteriota bacterium]|nr:inorganic pyrophosphatase [Acidobacteriota bacterium]
MERQGQVDFPRPFYRWRPHPWHGLDVGPEPPRLVHAYIEICPFDLVKYEVDKETGYLRVDRPQRTSSQHPSLYGFIPRTFCGDGVGALMEGALRGDGDPLDICVVSERPIARVEVIVNARVVGGLPMLDGGEADDKIVAVLENDTVWADVEELSDMPPALIERLRHYFLTYKLVPENAADVSIGDAYDRKHAETVIRAAISDYESQYGSG